MDKIDNLESLISWILDRFKFEDTVRITCGEDIDNKSIELCIIDNTEGKIKYEDLLRVFVSLVPWGMIIINHMLPDNFDDLRFQPILEALQQKDDIIIHTISDIDSGTSIIRKSPTSNPYLKRDIKDWDINGWTMLDHISLINPITCEEYLNKCEETVICAIAKQEQQYIEDWVSWHLKLGFDKIYLFDNNDKDSGENYKYLEQKFGNKIEVRDVRGEPGVQNMMYDMFFFENMYKWVAVIDIDEFISIDKDKFPDIKSFIESMPDADQIILRWQCFKGNPSNKPINEPIWEYCTEPVEPACRISSKTESIYGWFKSITRGGFNIRGNEHISWTIDNRVLRKYNSEGKYMETFYVPDVYGLLSGNVAVINHYIVKNISEFYYKKYKRGHAGLGGFENRDGIIWYGWCQNLQYYNEIQHTLSKEEQDFLLSKGYKSIWEFRPDIAVACHIEPIAHNTCEDKKKVLSYLYDHAYPRTWLLRNADIDDGFNVDVWDWVARSMWHSTCASTWMVGFSDLEWKSGQKELFINLGYDIDNILNQNDPEPYDGLDLIRSNEIFKDACQKVLEDPGICSVAERSVILDPDCGGFKDIVDDFCKEHGVENIGMKFKSNTYITSIDTYNEIRNAWGNFISQSWEDTKDIIEAHKSKEKSLRYDAWQFCYPCLFNDIYKVKSE